MVVLLHYSETTTVAETLVPKTRLSAQQESLHTACVVCSQKGGQGPKGATFIFHSSIWSPSNSSAQFTITRWHALVFITLLARRLISMNCGQSVIIIIMLYYNNDFIIGKGAFYV